MCARGDAISRTDEGDMGLFLLPKSMPDDEDYHCEPSKRRKLRYSPSDLVCACACACLRVDVQSSGCVLVYKQEREREREFVCMHARVCVHARVPKRERGARIIS